MNSTSKNAENKTVNNLGIAAKFIILSLIGIFVFFVPIRAGGGSTIPVEFLVSFLISSFKPVVRLYALAVILIAAVLPFIRKTWKKDALTTVFTFSKILGAVFTVIVFSGFGPEPIIRADHGPFLLGTCYPGWGPAPHRLHFSDLSYELRVYRFYRAVSPANHANHLENSGPFRRGRRRILYGR